MIRDDKHRPQWEVQLEILRADHAQAMRRVGDHIGQLYKLGEQLTRALEATDARIAELEAKFPKPKGADSSVEL